MSEYVLELKGITKIFPGVKALNNVQFQLKPGEVHALMGENGAGKSTFIKVITGVHKAEEGEMYLFGEKVDFKGPKDAQEAGIAAVYQHPTSYPHLTVAENIFMGHEIKDLFPKPEVKIGDEMLRIEHLSRTGYFKDVSFNVHAGEIVGLTGLVGAGRTEVVESVCGITTPDEGKVYLEGKEVHIKQPSDAMKEGIILLPEDRQKEGLIMSWGLGRNVTLPTISKYAKKGFNDEKTERDLSKRLLEEVDTKAVDIFQPASSLSGGNQQKVVVAKALSQEMKVVIMDEPTKGVDVGAKAEIYAIMGDLAKKGYAIILISSEMPEILGMSDRIVVMCNGRKTGELGRGEATQEMILELAMEKGTTGKGAAK